VSETRILLCDDHPLVRRAIGDALGDALADVAIEESGSLAEAMDRIARDPALDLILLDLTMPGADGLRGLLHILVAAPTTPVAIVSAAANPDTIHRAMACGASGYLPKSLALHDIVAGVRAILDGELVRPPDGSAIDDTTDDEAMRLAQLSPRQYDILMRIVDGRLNKQIAADLAIGEQTVKIHVSTILRKLQVGSRTQAALVAERVLRGGPRAGTD
jgi:DNA-binding NarL/FixJ family response regulator